MIINRGVFSPKMFLFLGGFGAIKVLVLDFCSGVSVVLVGHSFGKGVGPVQGGVLGASHLGARVK